MKIAGLWLFLLPFGMYYGISRGAAEPVTFYLQVRYNALLAFSPWKCVFSGAVTPYIETP